MGLWKHGRSPHRRGADGRGPAALCAQLSLIIAINIDHIRIIVIIIIIIITIIDMTNMNIIIIIIIIKITIFPTSDKYPPPGIKYFPPAEN